MPNGSAAAHINMNCNSGNGGGMGTQTGNNGRFSFAVPAGDYTCDIWIDPNDQSMAQLAAPDLSASVADGQTFDFGTITLVAKEGRIKGRVVNADGAGVAGVNVNAWVANGKGGWNQTRSGADGSYTMYVKGPAEYEVRVEQGPDSQYIYTGQALRASLTAANTTVTGLNFEVVQPNAEVNIRTVDANGDALTQIWGYAFCFKKNEQRGPGS
jgi:hypothetical protein